jgi:hypothetical protein
MTYHKHSMIKPFELHREDLLELENVIRSLFEPNQGRLDIAAGYEGKKISPQDCQSFNALLGQTTLPRELDALTVDASSLGTDGREEKHARVYISGRVADIHLDTTADQTWLDQANQRLQAFFQTRKVWFAPVAKTLPPIFNISTIISLALIFVAIYFEREGLVAFPVMLMVAAAILLTLGLNRIFFPYARISLASEDQDDRPHYEPWVLAAYILILLTCIIGVLAPTWSSILSAM